MTNATSNPDRRVQVTVKIHAAAAVHPSEIWPDSDPSATVTAAAVRDALERWPKDPVLIAELGLLDALTVTVSAPNPHWDPTEPLFPDLAPARYSSEQVWR